LGSQKYSWEKSPGVLRGEGLGQNLFSKTRGPNPLKSLKNFKFQKNTNIQKSPPLGV